MRPKTTVAAIWGLGVNGTKNNASAEKFDRQGFQSVIALEYYSRKSLKALLVMDYRKITFLKDTMKWRL